jgi:hypothetical protein
MQTPHEVTHVFGVGQWVRTTDTNRRGEVLELSPLFSMAYLRFENGQELWWSTLSIEPLMTTPERAT